MNHFCPACEKIQKWFFTHSLFDNLRFHRTLTREKNQFEKYSHFLQSKYWLTKGYSPHDGEYDRGRYFYLSRPYFRAPSPSVLVCGYLDDWRFDCPHGSLKLCRTGHFLSRGGWRLRIPPKCLWTQMGVSLRISYFFYNIPRFHCHWSWSYSALPGGVPLWSLGERYFF